MTKIADSLRVLLRDLIDYAGLFPPAALDMKSAVENYRRYLDGEFWWMLGRFVVPSTRLREVEQFIPENQPHPWALSVLVGPKIEGDIAVLQAFAPRYAELAVIDCVETKVSSLDDVAKAHQLIGSATTTYYEVPVTPELPRLLDAIKSVNGRAKIRTGGVTPDAIPSNKAVANFLLECATRDLPFKATAGLHHPMRCPKPLTYEPSAPVAVMHGFLNVFIAAIYLWRGGRDVECTQDFETKTGIAHAPFRYGLAATPWQLLDILKAETPFDFRNDGIHEAVEIPIEVIEQARKNFAISFGSCSFEEPIEDLKALNLL